MPYTFSTAPRYNAAQNHQLLTAKRIVTSLVASAAITIFLWFLAIVVAPSGGPVTGLALIATSITSALLLVVSFGKTYFPYQASPRAIATLKTAAQSKTVNVAYAATFELIEALGPAGTTRTQNSLPESLIYFASSKQIRHLLTWLQLDPAELGQVLSQTVAPKLTWEKWAQRMVTLANKYKQSAIAPEHALGVLLLLPSMRTYLRSKDLTEEDIHFAIGWSSAMRRARLHQKRWWDKERLLAFTGVGLSWASGFTPLVDRFARLPQGNAWDDILYGHEDKVNELINTLARQRQSNVLLVGQPGVGRLGIMRELTRRINNGQAHPELNGQRVLYINAGELIAQGGSSAGQLAMFTQALNEMEKAGNVITIIDGLSSILGGAGEQRVNLSDVLLPFLSSPNVRVLVVVSAEDYHLRLKSNQELAHYFEVVQVPSLSAEATLHRVALTLPGIEHGAGLFIPYKTARALVHDTASILPQIPFPERAFDFLEEAIVLAQTEGSKVLESRHIHTLISRKVGIDFGEMKDRERQQLLELEETMHRRLVNQSLAVKTLTHALIRARAEIRSTKRPIGTFLFLGPTGVGKTETAKTLAEAYFNSEENMIRLDMSEFQGPDGVARLIGSVNNPVGRLTSLIADNPFTVLLLDEFEKASAQVHQLFLQVFDEGHITDAAGRRYSFLHSIIIATSNAGAELIRREVKDGVIPEGFGETLKEHILGNNLLRPELLNRFDAVITYSPLTKDHIRQIANLMLSGLNRRLDAQHGVTIAVTDDLINYLVKIGYNPEFGARPMNRAIQDTVEFTVAQKVLKGETQPGQQITLPPETLQKAA